MYTGRTRPIYESVTFERYWSVKSVGQELQEVKVHTLSVNLGRGAPKFTLEVRTFRTSDSTQKLAIHG